MNRFIAQISSVALAFTALAATAQTLPVGFVREAVLSVSSPTALAFTPDGRMLVTTQGGTLLVKPPASATATTALTFGTTGATGLEVCSNSERGLLGVAVDPLFASNQYIYLFYTARNGSTCQTGTYVNGSGGYETTGRPVNRVSRFTLGNDNIVLPASESVIVNNMPSPGGNHNAGDVHFGKDGYLYISIGDGGNDYAGDSGGAGANDAARDKHVLTGKILRVTRTGGIPPDNPFTGAGTGTCAATGATTVGNHCQETFAWGLRNPFRFSMDSNAAGTRFFINDVGQGLWEEVDEGKSGADYGWNCREGAHVNSTTGKCSPSASPPPTNLVDPIFEYPHGGAVVPGTAVSGCNSITGGAFVPNGVWSAAYDNKYLLVDFVCAGMFAIPVAATPQTVVSAATTFATGVSSATTLKFGPIGNTQALYYTSYATGVSRIRYVRHLDIDNDGSVGAATDALLLMRYLVGLRDAPLIAGARGSGAQRNAAEIAAHIASLGNMLDFDGDGSVKATTDGLLVLRYLLGLRGSTLTNGASATTKPSDDIERDLRAILP
jgi:glucose/arabinose dehydrogenase